MSKAQIEINEKTELEKTVREKYLKKIAELPTGDLELLFRLASLNKLQRMMIKNHPMVKKYL